jgi:CheY-like chemotaxis protein
MVEAETLDVRPPAVTSRVVLVVEDNELNFELVSALLERDGFLLHWARDGSQALAAIAMYPLDLLILDLHLPHISGLDVLRRVRSDTATRDLPVLVLTADAMAGTREAVIAAGASEYLTKPFDASAFRAAIDRVLR